MKINMVVSGDKDLRKRKTPKNKSYMAMAKINLNSIQLYSTIPVL